MDLIYRHRVLSCHSSNSIKIIFLTLKISLKLISYIKKILIKSSVAEELVAKPESQIDAYEAGEDDRDSAVENLKNKLLESYLESLDSSDEEK